jgi:pimeloyl-ACP methyl ester carboxylesterase
MQPLWWFREQGEGFPLVLLHGLGASSFSWRENLGPLSRHFRVLAPDLPGHGRTPAASVPDFRLETLGQGILELLDRRRLPRAFVAGNSLGGSLALWLAAAAPRRFPALALLAPAAALRRLPLIFYPLRLPWVGPALAACLGPWIVPWGLKLAYHRRELITPEVVAGYAVTFRPLANRLALCRLARNQEAWPPTRVEALLGRITQPGCLVWGEQDRILPPSQARWLAARLPGWEFHLLPGVGHAPQEEAPDEVNQILVAFFRRSATII